MTDERAIFAALVAVLIVGAGAGWMAARNHYHVNAIEHGCAAYDTQTGDWHWIERADDD